MKVQRADIIGITTLSKSHRCGRFDGQTQFQPRACPKTKLVQSTAANVSLAKVVVPASSDDFHIVDKVIPVEKYTVQRTTYLPQVRECLFACLFHAISTYSLEGAAYNGRGCNDFGRSQID